ncbi:hypothetical protein Taro_051155 [Colocasia esculenta]|uniref:Uncharacterized protein n=1 Tax=Colocasia esculenta TaxID=4460 RepID=A0A843XG94_COLES|nr:hypothetical protein [Colocasia esculenta]
MVMAMKIEEVQSGTKKQKITTYAHIKGLGLEADVEEVAALIWTQNLQLDSFKSSRKDTLFDQFLDSLLATGCPATRSRKSGVAHLPRVQNIH